MASGFCWSFFCPVGAGQPGQLLRNPGENVGSKISAVRTRGAELAGLDHFEITLHGELLDHGGIQEAVIARVGNLSSIRRVEGLCHRRKEQEQGFLRLAWTR